MSDSDDDDWFSKDVEEYVADFKKIAKTKGNAFVSSDAANLDVGHHTIQYNEGNFLFFKTFPSHIPGPSPC